MKISIYLRHSIFLPWVGDLPEILKGKYEVEIIPITNLNQRNVHVSFWEKMASTINFIEIGFHEGEHFLYALDWETHAMSWGKMVLRIARFSPKHGRLILGNLIWLFRIAQKFRPLPDWVENEIARCKSDLFIVVPSNMPGSKESELIRGAEKYAIPSMIPIMTLDNLTSKGIHLAIPSKVVVWNSIQKDLLLNEHRIPKINIEVAGSLFFDSWYRKAQNFQRVKPDKEIVFKILYVCSSSRIANYRSSIQPNNTAEFISIIQLIQDLELIGKRQKLKIVLTIREHPTNKLDKKIHSYSSSGLEVRLAGGEFPNEVEDIANFTYQLRDCNLVAGLNTSAFLHAAALEIPCLVFSNPGISQVTSGTRHLKQLLNEGIVKKYSFEELEQTVARSEVISSEAVLAFLGIEEIRTSEKILGIIDDLIS